MVGEALSDRSKMGQSPEYERDSVRGVHRCEGLADERESGRKQRPRDKEGLIEGIGRGIETIKNIKDEG